MHNNTSRLAKASHDAGGFGATTEHESTGASASARALAAYLSIGTLFGILFTKAEVISWFRTESYHLRESPVRRMRG